MCNHKQSLCRESRNPRRSLARVQQQWAPCHSFRRSPSLSTRLRRRFGHAEHKASTSYSWLMCPMQSTISAFTRSMLRSNAAARLKVCFLKNFRIQPTGDEFLICNRFATAGGLFGWSWGAKETNKGGNRGHAGGPKGAEIETSNKHGPKGRRTYNKVGSQCVPRTLRANIVKHNEKRSSVAQK